MPFPQRRHYGYTPPGIDSPRAKANAITFLVSARSLEHVTAEGLARQYRLKPATAGQLLEQELRRRAV